MRAGLRACGAVILAAALVQVPVLHAQERRALPLPPKQALEYESICGKEDNSVDVEDYKGDLSAAYIAGGSAATVLLRWIKKTELEIALPNYKLGDIPGKNWCSGTRVSEDLVLTAAHCFDPLDGTSKSDYMKTPHKVAGGKVEYVAAPELALLMEVGFHYQTDPTGKLRDADFYPIVKLEEWTADNSQRVDYAVVRIGKDKVGNLPSTAKYVPSKLGKMEPQVGDRLVAFQHPQGEPMRVASGKLKSASIGEFRYAELDTLYGSSGAGLRDISGYIVGVHTHAGCTKKGGTNCGTRNSAIVPISKLLPPLMQ